MQALLEDIRFAARMLLKSPGYTLVAILTLALGIGANSAIFSAVNVVLVRPLPYPDPDALVIVIETQPGLERMAVPYLNYVDYRAEQRTFSEFEAMGFHSMNLTGSGDAEKLGVQMCSRGLFHLLGVAPALGRDFLAEEDLPRGARAVMLSHRYWNRRFAADPEIVGREIVLDDQAWTVTGVMPADYRPVIPVDLFVPLGSRAAEAAFQDRKARPEIYMIGRIRPDVTLAQVRADMQTIGEGLARRFPDQVGPSRPLVLPLSEEMVAGSRTSLLLLLGAVMLVLLIAAANVASLTLERALARRREMGIRAALGAGRWRLIRQLLVESLLLALAGGALGLLLALWGVDVLTAARPAAVSYETFGPIEIDRVVLGYTLLVALGTGLLFGLVPAIYASRQDLAQVLKSGDPHATASGGHLRARGVLVVVEVALAVMLVIGAVLAMRSLALLQRTDPGFDATNVLSSGVSLPPARYKDPQQVQQFWSEVQRHVAAIPGVVSVSTSTGVPLRDALFDSFFALGVARTPENTRMAVTYHVGVGYLETMKLPLLAGRTFTAQDTAGTPPVIVIDETLAQELFPGQDPVGQRLQERASGQPSVEIVGVVGHVKQQGFDAPDRTPYQIYYSHTQLPAAALQERAIGATMFLVMRTQDDPHAYIAQMRAAIAAVDPKLPMWATSTFAENMQDSLNPRRFSVALLGVFAAIALVLAVIGLYAVMANAVAQRSHELGVRMALGAPSRAVVGLVVRQGMTLVLLGAAFGLAGAVGLTRLMTALLTDKISPTDPLTYVVVTLILALVGLAATWIPARRATRIDPMVALRHE